MSESFILTDQGYHTLMDSAEIYWKACRPKAPSAYAQRGDEAARLWELSARLCGVGSATAA